MINIIIPRAFFSQLLTDDRLLTSEWQLLYSGPQESSLSDLNKALVLMVSIFLLIFISSCLSSKFSEQSKRANNNWYHVYSHIQQIF